MRRRAQARRQGEAVLNKTRRMLEQRDRLTYIFDRKKDMIIRGGYNIYSAELENLLYHYPGVAECAAVGRPDPVLGEKIHVFICRSDPELTEQDIKRFCAEHLTDYKILDLVTPPG